MNSDCDGCNGGISSLDSAAGAVQAVRLLPYLQQHYSEAFIDQICLVKIDTEVSGHCNGHGDISVFRVTMRSSWRT